jgi:Tfp pilus assembly protein PilO
MSGNDRTILLVIPVIAAVVAFWLLVLSPKQDQASKLDDQITGLQSEVADSQQAAQEGLQARQLFPRDYHRLVVIGKAVPVDDETASLLVQLNMIAEHSGAQFRAIDLSSSGSSDTSSTATTTAPAPTGAPSPSSGSTGSDSSSTSTASASTTAPPTTAAPPTESATALLPIGASVGSAGLATLPYDLTFRGTYSQIADFMAGVDRLVDPRKGRIAADGRLLTIDGFSLTADDSSPYPVLKATLQVTTYVTPADQGLTVGATPAGPSGVLATGAATAQSAAPATSTTPPTATSATPPATAASATP